MSGLPGIQGPSGERGERGERGLGGEAGLKGNAGKVGPRGPQGLRGMKGLQGVKGSKGGKGEVEKSNWKQCVWFRNDGKDSGLIQVMFIPSLPQSVIYRCFRQQICRFRKDHNNTALQVAYAGNLRVLCSSGECCSRLFFTFDGQECSGPMTIEGIVYGKPASDNPAHHRQIEGYCENIPAGDVTIEFNIGVCNKLTSTVYDGYTGWASVSRIMIKEVSSPQT